MHAVRHTMLFYPTPKHSIKEEIRKKRKGGPSIPTPFLFIDWKKSGVYHERKDRSLLKHIGGESVFTIKEFLRTEVKPALGCTEPGAVALAVARAKEELGGPVDAVTVTVSDSIYKNGVDVGIPGTEGLRGNNVAAALSDIGAPPTASMSSRTDGRRYRIGKGNAGKNAGKSLPISIVTEFS